MAIASAAPLQAGLPEIHLGLVPAWGGITRLPRTIDREEALDLLLTGRSIGYLRARSLGLVDRLASEADPAELLDRPAAPAVDDRARRRPNPGPSILERARERLDDQPGSFPEVQQRILAIVEIDMERGPEAAQEAAVKAFAELAVSPETRRVDHLVLPAQADAVLSLNSSVTRSPTGRGPDRGHRSTRRRHAPG